MSVSLLGLWIASLAAVTVVASPQSVVMDRCNVSDTLKPIASLYDRLASDPSPKSVQKKAQRRLITNLFSKIQSTTDCQVVKSEIQIYRELTALNSAQKNRDLPNIAYHPAEREQVEKVFRDYGPLYIDSAQESVRLDAKNSPWSGYWYPLSHIDYLTDDDSPLRKFDRILSRRRRATGVLKHERNQYAHLDEVDAWEGHCHAWSIASVVFPEPKGPVRVNGVKLSVSDIKAIYTKAAEATPYAQYGISYRGDFETDGTFQDIRPEAFHRVVMDQLQSHLPVLIDDDPGTEVWTRPVVGFRAQIKKKDASTVDVKAWLGLIKQRNEVSDELTNQRDRSFMVLSYRLYLGRETNREGHRRVIAGEWTGSSVAAHPDVLLVPSIENYKSYNPVLNTNHDVIEEFIESQ